MKYAYRIFEKLGFWGFVVTFTLLAIVVSEVLIVFQSYWLKGDFFDEDLLIVGFITPAIDAFILFTLAAFFLDSLRKENHQSQISLAHQEEAKNRLNQYLNIVDSMVVALDKNGCITLANQITCEAMGYEKESDLIGKDWFSLYIPEAHYEQVQKVFKEIVNGNLEPYKNYENPITSKDGQERLIAWSNDYILDDEGEIVGILSSGRDVTEERRAQNALEEQRNLLRTVIDQNPDPVVLKNWNGEFVLANQACAELYGTTPEEMIGKTDHAFIPDQDIADFFRRNVQEIMRKGQTEIVYEDSVDVETGHYRHYRSIKKPFKNALDENLILVLAQDITALKEAENALRTKESYQRALLDNFPFMVWLKDVEGRYLAANKAMYEAVGLSTDEQMIGRTDQDFWSAEQAQKNLQSDQKVIQTLQPKDEEIMFESDGESAWLETFKGPVLDAESKLLGTVGFARDISERKQELKEIYWMRYALQQIHDAYFLVDLAGNILSSNQAASDELGYALETLEAMQVFDLDPSLNVHTWKIHWEEVRRLGSVRIESTHKRSDGSKFPIEITVSYIHYENEDYLLALSRNISERRESQRKLRAAAEIAKLGYWELDFRSLELSFDASWFKMMGMPEDSNPKVSIEDFFNKFVEGDEQRLLVETHVKKASSEKKSYKDSFKLELTTPHYKTIESRVDYQVIYENELPVLAMGTTIDITDKNQQARLLEEERSRFELAIEGTQDGLWDWNPVTDEVFYSKRCLAMLGYEETGFGVHLEDWLNLLHPEDIEQAQKDVQRHIEGETEVYENKHRLKCQDGSWKWILARGKVRLNTQGEPIRFVGFNTDITEQVQHQEALDHSAKHDLLTDLPNRFLLNELLQTQMSRCDRNKSLIAVLYLDLDGFKQINDEHGHDVGDVVLVTTANRMKSVLRKVDLVSRIGGDEFVIVLSDLNDGDEILPLVQRLLHDLAQVIFYSNGSEASVDLKVTCSIGITIYPQKDNIGSDALLRQADQAMYQAKTAGKNRYSFFNLDETESLIEHHRYLARIRQAIDNQEMILHFQPKVRMSSGEVIGFEALVRWQSPEKGLIFPDHFLPIVNSDKETMLKLGAWVFEAAFKQLAEWNTQGHQFSLSINVSTHELHNNGIHDLLARLLKAYPNVRAQQVELEILETNALEDTSTAMKVITECQTQGYLVSLDDFGTGYSTLSYLKNLPVNTLKIDRSFVMDMLHDSASFSILEAAMGLAQAFRCHTVAEGVESEDHGVMLRQLGCDIAQGYVISKPLPPADIDRWLSEWQGFESWKSAYVMEYAFRDILYAEIEYRNWFKQIADYVKSPKISTLPELDADESILGKWIESEGNGFFGLAALRDLTAKHEEIHQLAEAIDDYIAAGDGEQVIQQLNADFKWMISHLTHLIQHS